MRTRTLRRLPIVGVVPVSALLQAQRPWTFAMTFAKVGPEQAPCEYACHEGNYAMRNRLGIARAAEAAARAK